MAEFTETYKVLVGAGTGVLSAQVNNHLREGWELVGGVSVTSYDDKDGKLSFQYCQAITLVDYDSQQ